MDTSQSPDAFTIERHGEVTLVSANPALERLDASMEEQVADVLMDPLRGQDGPLVVFDLTRVDYFGSMFLTVLLRCWKLTTARGGMMVLAGVSNHAKELLRLTSLDMIWPIYPTRREALEALLAD
jgi:anti-sigma B factor antagonist